MSMKEYVDLKNIKWEPQHAIFQLSQNKNYARHERMMIDAGKLDIKRVCEEVAKAWHLFPYTKDDIYYYFH